MTESSFKQAVYLFSVVIIPELKNDSAKTIFLNNFIKLLNGVDKTSSDDIRLLVKVILILSWFYNAKSFSKLSDDKRQGFIKKLYFFPYKKIVGGLTGLKSMVFISYYGIPSVWKDIKYDGPIISNSDLNE